MRDLNSLCWERSQLYWEYKCLKILVRTQIPLSWERYPLIKYENNSQDEESTMGQESPISWTDPDLWIL